MDIRQRKTNTVWSHIYVESKKDELIQAESRIVVARAGGGGNGEMLVKGYKLPVIR